MEELAELKRQLTEQRPDGWDRLPDIPLYMDQVVSYLSRQMISIGDGDPLTSAMINNYIKDGLVERAVGREMRAPERQYEYFCSYLDQAMNDAADRLDADTSDRDLPKLVLELAMRSYANGLACHRALAILAQRTGHEDLLKKKK